MNTFRLQDYDPVRVDVSEDAMRKFDHVFEDGKRVRVKETGHRGVLLGVNTRGAHTVKLDSGRTIQCRAFEIEPADFPAAQHSEPAPSKATITAEQFDALRSAVSLGKLDEWDAHLTKRAFGIIATTGVSPDGAETESERVLTEMCRKHLGISTSDVSSFQKAAGAGATFKIGDRVRDKWGHLGKIMAISQGRAEIAYDSGIQGSVLMGYFQAA